jgi:outer membrane receptor protein involved in Fe transport
MLALSAWAQTATTGVIEGRIRDQAGNPIADATVTAVANRAPVAAVTDSQGRFVLANLPPGTYKVRAESPGKAAVIQEPIVVSINQRSRVDFTLVGGQTETVTVTAEAPVVDTKSVTTGGSFKVDDFIDQIPVGRNLAATLTLAPGVESGGGTGAGNYSISGSSGLENSYVVDGVNITNTGYGGIGSYNIIFGSLGTGVTYDFLEEVQVKTGGIDVEYGQATGGVVNTVVKSGTNELSGAVSFYAGAPVNEFKQADLFIGATNFQKGDWDDNSTYDLGLSVGGPIMKDKLFYFVAYNPVIQKDAAAIQNIALPAGLADGFTAYPAATAGLQVRERTSNNYAGKLTWYANPNHRLELSAFGDPSEGDSGPQRFSLRNLDFAEGGGLSSIEYGANNYSLKYDAVFTPNFFMQAQVSRHDGEFLEDSVVNKSRYTDQRQLRCFLSPRFCTPGQSRDNAATWAYGGVGFISNSQDVNDQIKAVLTWTTGNNELKGGVEYNMIEYTDRQDYTGSDIPIKFNQNVGICVNDPSVGCASDQDCVDEGVGGTCTTAAQALATPCTSGFGDEPCHLILDTRGGIVATSRQSTTGVAQWRSTRGRFSPNAGPTETDDLSLFVQDTWAFTPKWTLKAGVRATQQEISGSGTYSLNARFADGTPSDVVLQPLSTPTTYKFDWAFAPRIGVTWDTMGDGRSKAYMNVARMFERIPNDLAIRALSNETSISTVTFGGWDTDLGIPTNQTSNGRIRGGQTTISPGTKLPYVDEFVVGWQQELGRDISYEIRGIYREQGRSLEDVQFTTVEATENYYIGYYFGTVAGGDIDQVPFPNDPDGEAGAPFGHYDLANPGENTVAGFPDAVRKYYALELLLNKRFGDNWLFYGNMRFARLRGNYEGLFRNDNGQSDPNITSLFDFPNSPLVAGQFEAGPLNTDRPFSMKLYGSYQWDNGFNAGAALNVAAGTPRTPLLAHPNGFYQNAGEVPGINPIYYWYSANGTCAAAACFTTGTANDFFQDTTAVIPTATYAFPHLYSYNEAGRGFLGRTSTETTIDLSVGWQRQFSRWATFAVGASVFNVLNSRETTQFNDNIELQAGVTDPDYLKPIGFQTPRNIRLFARWSF